MILMYGYRANEVRLSGQFSPTTVRHPFVWYGYRANQSPFSPHEVRRSYPFNVYHVLSGYSP